MSDISDYEDDGLGSPHTSQLGDDPKRHARAQHNALERRRRDNIKDMYSNLKDVVPEMQNERQASRAVILRKAIETISNKTQEFNEKEATIERLKRENEAIEKEIKFLQGRKSSVDQTEIVQAAIVRGFDTDSPATKRFCPQ